MDQLRPLQVTRASGNGTPKTSGGFSLIQEVENTREKRDAPGPRRPTKPEDCYQILRDQPDYESLTSTLLFLSRPPREDPNAFALWKPTPVGGQIIHALVTNTAPNYWANMKEDAGVGQDSCMDLFVSCVRCVAGVNCILTRLKALVKEAKSEGQAKGPPSYLEVETMLDLLGRVLLGDSVILDMWRDAAAGDGDKARVKPLTDGMLSLFGGGIIISVSAEATELLKDKSPDLWFSRIPDYAEWLSRNVARGQLESPTPSQSKFFSQLFERGSRLGDFSKMTRTVVSKLLVAQSTDQTKFAVLMDGLQQKEQRRVLFEVLQILSTDHLHRLGNCTSRESPAMVSAVAAAVDLIVNGVPLRVDHLVQWLTAPSGAGAADGVGIRRAVLAVLAKDMSSMVKVLESSISQFADKLYLGFTPIVQQEAHAQVILLSAGYVARGSKMKLRSVTRSASYPNMISNRIAALTSRARFLGMVVGEAISALIDEKSLDFKNDETNSPEGLWYKGLTGVSDTIGPIEPLIKASQPSSDLELSKVARKEPKVVNIPRKQNKPPPKPVAARHGKPATTGIRIVEEVSDDDLGGGVAPYAKPDSDAEDSEEDATLVRRDKLTSPVYIRDLIAYFRKTDSYDHQKLALTTAPTLIRRKANYGSEVADHSDEVASLLAGLQNTYDMEDFDNLRLQGMIALVVASPKTMGEWFAKTFFDGDYSIAQRASILVTLGLAAREIAGLDESKYAAGSSFASKSLPEQIEKLYLDQNASTRALPSSSSLKPLAPNALEKIARSVTSDILAPLAAAAADKATGPDALKLSTFTSRLTKTNKSKTTSARRNPPKTNTVTTQILAKSLFYPLTARFQSALHSTTQRSKIFVFQPYLLGLLLKTLGLVLHATGPFTLEVQQMTSELWTLAMSPPVLKQAAGDLTLRNSVLFALLAILDVNVDRMREVCRGMGKEVVEAREWAATVYGATAGGDRGEEEETKGMAAAVLVRLSGAMEEWRLAMVGDLVGFE
ncbi:DNA replication checkpoint protein tel2 [Podospora conica]|nr:DNA replication checkpoint protein tel2 [Schizothecium conicum]